LFSAIIFLNIVSSSANADHKTHEITNCNTGNIIQYLRRLAWNLLVVRALEVASRYSLLIWGKCRKPFSQVWIFTVEKGIFPNTNSILENSKQREEKKLKFYLTLTILYSKSILSDQGDKVLCC
jgi:hypothetical protein